MANKRILQFDTAEQLEDDDYLLIDHQDEGTRKILASAVGGGSKAYSGATEPASSFGKNGDIYFQIENLFNPEFIVAEIWENVSVTKKANGKYTIVTSGTGNNQEEYVSYKIKNLEVGKEYTFKFNAQMSSGASFYDSNTYGLIFADGSSDYISNLTGTAGEFDDENNYMPFYRDTDNHNYECTITAIAETMYLIFGYAGVQDGTNNTLTIDDLECSNPYITTIWTKNNDIWVKNLPVVNEGGGGSESYSETLLYDSGSNTQGAAIGVNVALLDNLSKYDMGYVVWSTASDRGQAGNQSSDLTYFSVPFVLIDDNYHRLHGAGYGTRWFQIKFTDTTFNIFGRGGDLNPEIYKIYGIKF